MLLQIVNQGIKCNLFPDAGEDDEKGSEQRDEDDTQRDGGHVCGDGRPIGVIVKSGTAIVSKRIEPASHFICR